MRHPLKQAVDLLLGDTENSANKTVRCEARPDLTTDLTWIVLQSPPARHLLPVFLMAELQVEQRRQQGGLGMLQSDGEGRELHQMVLFHARVDLCRLGERGGKR